MCIFSATASPFLPTLFVPDVQAHVFLTKMYSNLCARSVVILFRRSECFQFIVENARSDGTELARV